MFPGDDGEPGFVGEGRECLPVPRALWPVFPHIHLYIVDTGTINDIYYIVDYNLVNFWAYVPIQWYSHGDAGQGRAKGICACRQPLHDPMSICSVK